MGVFGKLKNKINNLRFAHMLNSGQPVFSQFGNNIYASDIVQSIVDCIVTEMTKLTPKHIRTEGNDRVPVKSAVQRVLNNPNYLMTRSDFMSKIVWNLFLNYNALVYPIYDNGILVEMYPIQPKIVDFLEDERGKLFIKMRFENNQEFTIPYENIIHIRYKFSFNDFLGGNKNGQPDNSALLKLLDMNENLIEGTLKAMKTSFNINGILKSGSIMDREKTEKMVAEFNEKLKNGDSGILGVDGKSDYIAVDKKPQLIDPETLKFIDSRILRMFGVSMPILTGDYTKEQYDAFYQKKIEPLVISISQAFTKGLFTVNERNHGNEVVFLPRALVFMSTTQVLEALRILGDSGDLYENEKRMALGYEPLEELIGKRMQSLNYVNAEIADKVQLKDKKEVKE